MEEILKKIIEIEHEAQALVAEGLTQKEKVQMDTQDEIKAMGVNILEMSQHKIEQLESKNRKEAEVRLQRIYEQTAIKMGLLEESVKENQELWENQIFDRIVGR